MGTKRDISCTGNIVATIAVAAVILTTKDINTSEAEPAASSILRSVWTGKARC